MRALQPRRNTGTRIPARIHYMFTIMVLRMIQQGLNPGLSETPRASVEGLFLAPDDGLGVGIGIQILLQLGPGEGVELFYARYGCVG